MLLFWRIFVIRIMVIALIIAATGFMTASFRSAGLATPVLERNLAPRMITGQVGNVRRYRGGKLNIVIKNPVITRGPVLDNIRIKVNKFDQLPRPGDRIRLRAGLMPPPPPSMPGDFDYARRLWFQGIGAVGFAIGSPEIIDRAQGLRGLSTRQRIRIADTIQTTIGSDAGGLAAALITGLRDGIPPEVAENMRNSGLAHLLAISGLHMGLLTGAAFFFIRFLLSRSEYLTLRYPIRKWAAVAAMGAGGIYLYLSGASIPTVRAFVMVFIVFLGIVMDRKAISLRLVAIAAMVILVASPESLLSVSFQMSFAAVVALIAAYEGMAGRWTDFSGRHRGRGQRAVLYLATLLFTTLVAEVAIAPFALFHFNKLVQYGLLANLVAMPVMAVWVMPLIVAYLVLAPFGLGVLALVPMSWGLEVIMFVAKTVSHAPGAYSLVPFINMGPLVIMVFGALWLALWRLRWRYLGLPVVAVGIIMALFTGRPDILIDNSGRLIGVRDANNALSLSGLRAGRMARRRWAQRFGQEKAEKWTYEGAADSWMSCDRLSCLYRPAKDGDTLLIALVKDELALPEDCRNAGLVISLVPVEIDCPSARLVIDRWDFYHNGGYALWLPDHHGGKITVRTVAESRGERPWSRRR